MQITKKGKLLAAILGVVFIAYNVILFIIAGFADHKAVFWVSWVFMLIAFASMASVLALLGQRGMFLKDWLFGFPVIRHTTIYIFAEFAASLTFMIIEKVVPFWVCFSVQFLFLAVYAVFAISCFLAKETIEDVRTNVADKTRFLKLMRVDSEMLVTKCQDPAVKEECRKLAEAIRYSDPMSSESLFELEKELALTISECDKAVTAGDNAQASELCKKAMLQLEERNRKCKALK